MTDVDLISKTYKSLDGFKESFSFFSNNVAALKDILNPGDDISCVLFVHTIISKKYFEF